MLNEKNIYDQTFAYIITEFQNCNNAKYENIMEICNVFNNYFVDKKQCDFNEISILDFYITNLKIVLKNDNMKFNTEKFNNIFNINCVEYGINEELMELCNDYKKEIDKLMEFASTMLAADSIKKMTIMEIIMFVQNI